MKVKQKAFAKISIIITAIVLVAIFILGIALFKNYTKADSFYYPSDSNQSANSQSSLPACETETATNCQIVPGQKDSKYRECEGTGTVPLEVSPMNPEDVGIIIPMGAMIGSHVTPIDHMYFQPIVFHSPPDTYNVYADADGVIKGIGREPKFPENKYDKYRIEIRHTCDFYSIYNLLTSLSPEIKKITGEIEPGSYSNKPIHVKKGDLLGKIGGQTLDLSVNYDNITLSGFLVQEHYAGESWKLHTVDPFDYFTEPIKTQLLSKNVRQAEPRGGKIDYDLDGYLVGNWFIEGSGGFPEKYIEDSWKNHLSFAYDPIDPSHIIISIGNYDKFAEQSSLSSNDEMRLQYSINGNSPNPKEISVSSGLIKYELVETMYALSNGESWDRMSYANDIKAMGGNYVKGTALVQMISERKLKFEAFPGKTGEQVNGFTEKALVYER